MASADIEAAVFRTLGFGTELTTRELRFFYIVVEFQFIEIFCASVYTLPRGFHIHFRLVAEAFVEGEPVLAHVWYA